MLVVVSVLGFLMVGLTQGVRAGLAMWEAQSRRVGETSEIDAAARILRILFSAITLPQASAPAADTAFGTEFKGTPDSVTFVGDLPTGLGTTRRANITVELRQGRLVLRWTPRRARALQRAAARSRRNRTDPARRPARTRLLGWSLSRRAGRMAGTMGWGDNTRTDPIAPLLRRGRPAPVSRLNRRAAALT